MKLKMIKMGHSNAGSFLDKKDWYPFSVFGYKCMHLYADNLVYAQLYGGSIAKIT